MSTDKIQFALEKRADPGTGVLVDTLLKQTVGADGKIVSEEPWGSVLDYNRLFDTCVKRWGGNWDLNKVCLAIEESEIN